MAALNLHHAIFNNEKDSDLPLRSASSFLRPAPERDEGPTSQLFSSAAYQDLIQRQPTHPDGPTSGWDLGLNLLGDPITAAEHKSLEDHRTKMKLRRLHAINIVFELLFGIWGTYTTIRYSLALADGVGGTAHVCALILGIMSALAVALLIVSILMPLLSGPCRCAWGYTRLLLRASYLFLLSASAVMNLVLVLLWHPSRLCDWDLDISWYTFAVDTTTSPCRTAPFSAWIAAGVLRLVVTLAMALTYIYTLRSYHRTRHPTSEGNGPRCLGSDPEEMTPVSTSPPLRFSKSTFKFARSEDSNYYPKSNSISTLALSTGHSRSHSTPPRRDVSLPRISPSTSRRTSSQRTSYGSSTTQAGYETPFQMQSVSAVTAPSHMLRRTSRISVTHVASDTLLSDLSPHPERLDRPMTCDPPEIRSSAPWRPGQHGGGAHLEGRKTGLGWEVRRASLASVGPDSLSTTYGEGESTPEKDKGDGDDDDEYAYGYGASGPAYPYLDMYHPQRPGGYAEASSHCEDEDRFLQGHRYAVPGGPAIPDVSSEPRSSPSREEVVEMVGEEEESSGEEEEYVAMMGGFVRRMATIESLGSKEAAGTLSTTGSVARHSVRSGAPTSQFSSVRFAGRASSRTSSLGVHSGREGSGSLGTAYLSFSSGDTGVRVNERGELVLPDGGAAGSLYDRHYYTASGSSFPRMDGED